VVKTFAERLAASWSQVDAAAGAATRALERFRHEIDFARRLAEARPEKQSAWQDLILKAVDLVRSRVGGGKAVDIDAVVREAEAVLAPIGQAAKEYTIHCVGHAHIDMNWMWSWPETVSVTNDTFTTVDQLMDEYGDFRFSQSQASTYYLVERYLPELFERLKQRIRQGRWEVTASMWVEGDKNLASGEILCRHLLYTKRFMKQRFGLEYDHIKIDWEPDLFGHPYTLPGILVRGGVSRYYFCRGGRGPRLFWWQGPDGSRVLAFDDGILWYNGTITPDMTRLLFEFEKATGLKDYLFVYGVGDHGGGPTRRDLDAVAEMNSWPVFPNVKLSTTDAFFTIAEKHAADLPVVTDELNFVFEGCYTSQSNIKLANRLSENALVEAEAAAILAGVAAGGPYPADSLREAWRHAMFSQFHDILPGSGVHATYEYSQGLFQEILAITGSVKTRALRSVAGAVDTAAVAPSVPAEARRPGPGLGAGAGDRSAFGQVSTRGAGEATVHPFVVFNPSPWARSEIVTAKLWNTDLPAEAIRVLDETGQSLPAQVLERGGYWGHEFISVALPARDVPGLGYRTYCLTRAYEPLTVQGASADESGKLQNERFEVHVEAGSGSIVHLIDKHTGYDLVPPGGRIGLLQMLLEAPHGMTAWQIGQIVKQTDLIDGATIEVVHRGPYVAAIRSRRTYNDSRFSLTISLKAGSGCVEFELEVDWLERGTPEVGVPVLRAVFPLAIAEAKATYEVPCGHIERPANGQEVPALRWADLTGLPEGHLAQQSAGATLVNDCKYGHSALGSTLRLTLLRSSYDPDPLPELGEHRIRFGLVPHIGPWSASQATRAAAAFNHPFSVVATTVHTGDLPGSKGFCTVEPENVMLSAIKRAEDSDALILRLYEMEGQATEACVTLDESLARPGSPVVETDLLERELESSNARMQDQTLIVPVPAFGIATVKIG